MVGKPLRDGKRDGGPHDASPGGLCAEHRGIVDACGDPSVLQRPTEGISSGDLDDVQVQGVAAAWMTRKWIHRCAGEVFVVAERERFPAQSLFAQSGEPLAQEGRLEFAHSAVDPGLPSSVGAQRAEAFSETGVCCRHRSRVAEGGELLRGVEAEASERPKVPRRSPVEGRAERMGAVFDYMQLAISCERAKRQHVRAVPVQVDG